MYKFTQIDNNVLNSSPEVKIPDWINDINFEKPVEKQMNISPDYSVINQRHVIANRNDNVAYTREIKLSFNDEMLCNYAKTKLSLMLKNKKFIIEAQRVNNKKVELDITFEKNPAKYTFYYHDENGKIQPGKTFTASYNNTINEYPFSVAGLEDSFEDIQNGIKKQSNLVLEPNGYTVMSRYEIVKRFNNSIQKASEAINQNLKEGNIVGVGSNEYASIYNLDLLFPDLRKPLEKEASHTADFVENTISTDINEKKTAQRLSLEASIHNQDFTVEEIIKSKRNDTNLVVTAKISNHGIIHTPTFNYKIENEKVIPYAVKLNNKIYKYDDFIKQIKRASKCISEKTSETSNQNHSYIGTYRNLYAKLENIVSKPVAKKLVQYWLSQNMIQSHDSEKYASTMSLNNLLDKTDDVSYLTDDEVSELIKSKSKFGSNMKFYQMLVKDNDTRSNLLANKLASKNEAIKNLVKSYDEHPIITDDYVTFNYNGKQIIGKYQNDDITCFIKNKKIALKDLKSNSKLLQAFLQDNKESNGHKIIITTAMFHNKLKDYIKEHEINTVIAYLEDKNKLQKIDEHTYVSENDFDELIKDINISPDESIKQANLEKANRLRKAFELYHLEDNDTRNIELLDKHSEVLAGINHFLGKYFDNYKIQYLTSKDINVKFNNKSFYTSLDYQDGKIVSASCKIGKHLIPITQVHEAFKQNELLKQYLSDHKANDCYNIVITAKSIHNQLGDYLSEDNINQTISNLINQNYLVEIGTDKYVSKYTFDELLNKVDIVPDKFLKAERLKKANRLHEAFEFYHLEDNDTRNIELLDKHHEVLAGINNYLNQYFDNYKIQYLTDDAINVKFNNKSFYTKLEYKDDKIVSASCKIKNRMIPITQVHNAFKQNALLRQYLSNHKESDYSIIITAKSIHEKLHDYLDEQDINELIQTLIKKHALMEIGTDKYASNNSFDDLIRDIDKINPNLKSEHLKLANRLEQYKSQKITVQDSDNRKANKILTLSDWKNLVSKPISDHIIIAEILNASISKDEANAELKLFNNDLGIHSIITAKSKINNDKFSDIRYFVNGKEVLPQDTFIINRLAKKTSELQTSSDNPIIFSKHDLQNKLAFLTDVNQINSVIDKWEQSNLISDLGNNKYASKHTITELISSSNLKAYSDEKISDNYRHANKANIMIPKSYHTNNFEAKMLSNVKDGKTSDELNALKEKTIALAKQYVDEKILTANRFDQIKSMIEQSNDVSQLNLAYKKIERYKL